MIRLLEQYSQDFLWRVSKLSKNPNVLIIEVLGPIRGLWVFVVTKTRTTMDKETYNARFTRE